MFKSGSDISEAFWVSFLSLSASKIRVRVSATKTPSTRWWERQRVTATDISVQMEGEMESIEESLLRRNLKPSQTSVGSCSIKFQGLCIILHGSWLCLLGSHFCFLNHLSFFMKVSMCLRLGSCINLFPASRSLDSRSLILFVLSAYISVQAGIWLK